MCVRWYVTYLLSLRHSEETIAERERGGNICIGRSTSRNRPWTFSSWPRRTSQPSQRGPGDVTELLEELDAHVGGVAGRVG